MVMKSIRLMNVNTNNNLLSVDNQLITTIPLAQNLHSRQQSYSQNDQLIVFKGELVLDDNDNPLKCEHDGDDIQVYIKKRNKMNDMTPEELEEVDELEVVED
ncbi:hypothetical protein FRX31_008094 [Thalictrum thalictroides]|uniref:Uncharacterized protein n=1 Tax=Thalictrum thalictroides TaxID=46969 RepID=A0A7J6WXZ4_THATH|nr:hypothetical protein FRX31_008094 [Thalictrum thalictroides]